jgi:hypothetical protein
MPLNTIRLAGDIPRNMFNNGGRFIIRMEKFKNGMCPTCERIKVAAPMNHNRQPNFQARVK